MRKHLFTIVLVALVGIFCGQAYAQDQLAYARNGKWYVHNSVVQSIPGFDPSAPVYVACGEDLRVLPGPVGNAWLQDASLKATWAEYRMTKEGEFWTLIVPSELKAYEQVRFNVAQADGATKWAQIHKFTGRIPYTAKLVDGKWHNGIVLPTK